MKFLLLTVLALLMHSQHVCGQALHWLSQPNFDIGPIANNGASVVKISTNGRYITFISEASNLVANDNNNIADVFIKDKQTGIIELVSITASNIQANNGEINGVSAATADGRYIAFISNSVAFPSANGLGFYLYIKDMQTGTLTNASNYNGNSYFEVVLGEIYLSNDGQFITFTTTAQINPLHDVAYYQVYRKDIANTTFELLSISHDGLTAADISTQLIDVSNTGRYVLISSSAENLTTDVINNSGKNIFIKDTQMNTMTLVNITPTGVNSSGNGGSNSSEAAISNQGQVVFMSEQSDLVNNDTNGRDDVFYYENGTIIRLNLDANGNELTNSGYSQGVTISGDGSRIAFTESSDELFPAFTNNGVDLYSYETVSGILSLISKNVIGTKANGDSYQPDLSTAGNRIVFLSKATDLSGDPLTGQHQSVFYYNFNTLLMKNELLAESSPNTIISDTIYPTISSDQMSVIYSSRSLNLAFEPIYNDTLDLFLLDRNTNTHSKIASNALYLKTDISASGNFITFRSQYLPPEGLTELEEVFIFLFDRINNNYTQIAEGRDSKVNDDGVVVFISYENLDINDTNLQKDVYAYNPNSQNLLLVSKDLDAFASSAIDMDVGGSKGNIWVTFSSDSSNIVTNDNNATIDVFLKNLTSADPITRVTETMIGTESNERSTDPVISEDGNWIAFMTEADNLTNDDYTSANFNQVMVFDRINESFSLASINESGMPFTELGTNSVKDVSISDSGRYISYSYEDKGDLASSHIENQLGNGSNFAADSDEKMDVILFDTTTQTPLIISQHINGLQSDDDVNFPTHVVEDLTVFPPLVGVVFAAIGGDLTGLPGHPGYSETYLYQQIIPPNTEIIFKNGFE